MFSSAAEIAFQLAKKEFQEAQRKSHLTAHILLQASLLPPGLSTPHGQNMRERGRGKPGDVSNKSHDSYETPAVAQPETRVSPFEQEMVGTSAADIPVERLPDGDSDGCVEREVNFLCSRAKSMGDLLESVPQIKDTPSLMVRALIDLSCSNVRRWKTSIEVEVQESEVKVSDASAERLPDDVSVGCVRSEVYLADAVQGGVAEGFLGAQYDIASQDGDEDSLWSGPKSMGDLLESVPRVKDKPSQTVRALIDLRCSNVRRWKTSIEVEVQESDSFAKREIAKDCASMADVEVLPVPERAASWDGVPKGTVQPARQLVTVEQAEQSQLIGALELSVYSPWMRHLSEEQIALAKALERARAALYRGRRSSVQGGAVRGGAAAELVPEEPEEPLTPKSSLRAARAVAQVFVDAETGGRKRTTRSWSWGLC